MSLNAVNPHINATVSASAGSGKTWLLITRIVRLLLAGAEPGNILALTFTRKAAGEMQIRLNQRLLEMATASDEKLIALLKEAGCVSDEKHQTIARNLYEKLLHNLYPVRLQTFHSFCQDILSKFPIEADIPPGFELLEDTGLLEQQAWQALFVHATQAPDSELSEHLDTLMQSCNGAANTRTALDNFISHRSDWWAFTRGQSQAVDYANEQLTQTLQIPASAKTDTYQPTKDFFNQAIIDDLLIFANFLREQPNAAANAKNADTIDAVLKSDRSTANSSEHAFKTLLSAFLTKANKPLARKDTKVLQKKIGEDNAIRFLELHFSICEQLLETIDIQQRLETLSINHAWCFVGEQLLSVFQKLKRQQRLLDFVDLEWKCFELINEADNAQWIQYKIDQRIDHILIDEFQDTNPTQWHLLAPILEEIAAAYNDQQDNERWRSVFLVGDEKQSIYSFRRANPKLQAQASSWLAEHLNAEATPLDASRRSSQAIMDCVNNIFLQDEVQAVMPGYSKHETWLKKLPGKVCLSELFQRATDTSDEKNKDDDSAPIVFRNPLEEPRLNDKIDSHFDEATHIATQIQQLINEETLITDEDLIDKNKVRHVEYGDIMILMRNRVHIDTYENILRQKGIPFIGSKRGGLLDNVEIQDLIRLLETLITPFNNLALAQVLKSPIFSASDDDLKILAQNNESPYWYERLQNIFNEADKHTISTALTRAATLLPRWRELANTLPIHDCLDKIFVEANILQRYGSSANDNNKLRVAANCQRLLELSLENDSGRYPGISHFLEYLKSTQQHSKSPLDEPLVKNKESRVSLLTIHASKGLEAPIIFLADCNSSPSNKSAYATYVHWPEDSNRPLNFMLQMGKKNTDKITTELQQMKALEAQREDLNLLYVALTRAREQLYISGIESRSKETGWYDLIKQGFDNFAYEQAGINDSTCFVNQHLDYSAANITNKTTSSLTASEHEASNKLETAIDKRLQQPIAKTQNSQVLLAPSKQDKDAYVKTEQTDTDHSEQAEKLSTDLDARLRGMIIHRAIELLSAQNTLSEGQHIQRQLAVDFCYPQDNPLIQQCYDEAKNIVNNPDFASIFSPDEASDCFNELPVLYQQEETGKDAQSIYGLIDRVIKTDNSVTIIDYKSHRLDNNQDSQAFAEQFRPQLQYYQQGLKKIWPKLEFKMAILFTHTSDLIWL